MLVAVEILLIGGGIGIAGEEIWSEIEPHKLGICSVVDRWRHRCARIARLKHDDSSTVVTSMGSSKMKLV
jgi:hypothetical protein